jgi:hypothetical protein
MRPLTAELRQWRFRKAFRIDRASLLPDTLPDALTGALPGTVPDPVPDTVPGPEADTGQTLLDEKRLAEAATQLWRAQRRLARGDGPRDRQTARYLVTCREALTDAGLTMQDHDGDPYHPGRSLEVLAFSDDPGLAAEIVVETVRPTVYLLDRRIQMGQVIVAGPPDRGSGQE